MRIASVTLTNVKSFRSPVTVNFDDSFSVLVGPNGAGKSNLLDILTVVIRHYFIRGFLVQEQNDAAGLFQIIQQANPFADFQRGLEKFIGNESADQEIVLSVKVGTSDIRNISSAKAHKVTLQSALSEYRTKPTPSLDFVDKWDPALLADGMTISYTIRNWAIDGASQTPAHHLFLSYLNQLELLLILSRHQSAIDIRANYLFFSPYRGASPKDLQANLSSENYYQLLTEYFASTSRTLTSLIKIATLFFADKRRRYEDSASNSGYDAKWAADPEVIMVSKYMAKLGFSWSLDCVVPSKNIYEIRLCRDGKSISVHQASSGEKEIINFLLGIFAFNMEDGLVIVDEPELHLHPKWQDVLRNLFQEIAMATKNQIIVSTHSPVFITPDTIGSVRRVYKDAENSSKVAVLSNGVTGTDRDILHIVNSHNNEKMFFADKVVLVEGIKDRLVLAAYINSYRIASGLTDIIEVLEVHGKMSFDKYRRFLASLNVPTFTISDLDYLRETGSAETRTLFETDYRAIEEEVFKKKGSADGRRLSQALKDAISQRDFAVLEPIWKYICARLSRLKPGLTPTERKIIDDDISRLRGEHLYVLSLGEIEQYLPAGQHELDNVIALVREPALQQWMQASAESVEFQDIEFIVFEILNIARARRDIIRSAVLGGALSIEKRAQEAGR